VILKAIVSGLGVAVLTTGCTFMPQPTHDVTTETPSYDATVSARIRVLTGNGTGGAAFRPGESCYKSVLEPDDKKIVAGDGFWSAWKYSSRTVVIGMPQSPRLWMTVDGLQFKDMIREYVIPAAKPLAIGMSTSSSAGIYHSSCTPPWVSFTPQPGQDYDIFLRSEKRSCWIAVQRIDGHGMDEPVTVARAPKCSAEGSAAIQ
jgi:hypothetical protein